MAKETQKFTKADLCRRLEQAFLDDNFYQVCVINAYISPQNEKSL